MPALPPSRPKPLCLVPPNGAAGVICPIPFTMTVPGVELPYEAVDAMRVLRVQVGGQSELAVIGFREDLLLGLESQDGQYRTEHLRPGQVTVLVHITENRSEQRTTRLPTPH